MRTMLPRRSWMDCSRRLRRSARRAFAVSTATSPILAPRPGPIRCRNMPSYLNSSLPTPPGRMHPTSRWSSMQWTCFIAVGSMDFVWFPRTVILPGLPPASVSKASMFSGSESRKLRRASGRPVEGSSTPRTCVPDAANSQDAASTSKPLQPPSAATPIIMKVITQMESEDGWVPLGEVGKQLANLASDFDPENFRLSQAKRSGAKDKFVRNRSFERRLHAHSHKIRCRIPPKSKTVNKTAT